VREVWRQVGEQPLGERHGLEQQRLALQSVAWASGMHHRAKVERRERWLERARSVVLPGGEQVGTQVKQQVGSARRPGGRGLHGKGVDDLGCGSRIFWVDTVEEGQHIAKERIGVIVGQEGVEARQGGMVRCGREQWQTDKGADEQVGGEMPLQVAIRAGCGPGADDLGADEQIDGVGGRGAFGAVDVIVVGADGHNRSGIVGVSDLEERMVGAAE
jgi:hypothetical protein